MMIASLTKRLFLSVKFRATEYVAKPGPIPLKVLIATWFFFASLRWYPDQIVFENLLDLLFLVLH